MTTTAHFAACTDCGQLYVDQEGGGYLFLSPATLAELMDADGWQPDPPLCRACQPVETPPAELEAAGQMRLPGVA